MVKRIIVAFAVLVSGCATSPPAASPSPPPASDEASAVEISYFLGHASHRFVAEASGSGAVARSFLDRSILREGEVEKARYLEFLAKASKFVESPARAPAESCRNPFTVTVRIGAMTRTTQGCRATDERGLSRLVREGEFLLYSKK